MKSRQMDLPRKKILFVCIGNSCRSQMAEALARHHASDLIDAESAGTSPLGVVSPEALAVLQEIGIRAEGHYSKSISDALQFFAPEVVVNMSGRKLNQSFAAAEILEWKVGDPYGSDLETYRRICEDIERRVKKLADELSEKRK